MKPGIVDSYIPPFSSTVAGQSNADSLWHDNALWGHGNVHRVFVIRRWLRMNYVFDMAPRPFRQHFSGRILDIFKSFPYVQTDRRSHHH